jgi:hypothetical protein
MQDDDLQTIFLNIVLVKMMMISGRLDQRLARLFTVYVVLVTQLPF